MRYEVFLLKHAERDLSDIVEYIDLYDVIGKSIQVLNEFQKKIHSLSDTPERVTYPKELINLGIRKYREIYFKPYRIIYQVIENQVFVHLIADGRRDMLALLERRILAP